MNKPSAANRPDFIGDEPPLPYAFIQWKGTDACFDFHCTCGADLHYDGDFAYFVQCGACELVWEMPHYLYPRPASADESPLRRLEPDED